MRSLSFSIFSWASGCSCRYRSVKKAWWGQEGPLGTPLPGPNSAPWLCTRAGERARPTLCVSNRRTAGDGPSPALRAKRLLGPNTTDVETLNGAARRGISGGISVLGTQADLDAQPAGRQLPSALTPALPPTPGWSSTSGCLQPRAVSRSRAMTPRGLLSASVLTLSGQGLSKLF